VGRMLCHCASVLTFQASEGYVYFKVLKKLIKKYLIIPVPVDDIINKILVSRHLPK
jgi:hypothetical protein